MSRLFSFGRRRKIEDINKNVENNVNQDVNNSVEISLETGINTPISMINTKDTKYSKCISQSEKKFACNPGDKKNTQGKYLKYSESRIIKRELEIYKLLDVGVPQENREPLDKDGIFHIKTPDTCNPSPYINDDIKSTCTTNNNTLAPVGMIMHNICYLSCFDGFFNLL